MLPRPGRPFKRTGGHPVVLPASRSAVRGAADAATPIKRLEYRALSVSTPTLEGLLYGQPTAFDEVFRSDTRVQGYTHDFYKYPARFSPSFVRFILESLTEPGDYVLDPFMGGGTTIVEAAVSGRKAIGTDVNALARFVTGAKTTPLSEGDIAEVRTWVQAVRTALVQGRATTQPTESPIRNLPVETYPFFATATELVGRLRFRRRRRFARCALVRVGQWALDGRRSLPGVVALSDELEKRVEQMLGGLSEFVSAASKEGVAKHKITAARRLMPYSAADPHLAQTLRRRKIRPKLILTSPPYPGVHVLYHRWQVLGRRETPAPYWIADIHDGNGASYYTMGSRSVLGLENYFTGLSSAFVNLKKIVAQDARIVQLISFSDAPIQLPRYVDAMAAAGFEETSAYGLVSRQVRSVPNRKWYNQQRLSNDASKEVMLIHRPID